MATVVLPRSLVALVTGSERRAEVDGGHGGRGARGPRRRWPGMRDRVCDPGPVLRRHINVFVDGERAGLETPLPPGATLHVIPAVSGGSETATPRRRAIVGGARMIS